MQDGHRLKAFAQRVANRMVNGLLTRVYDAWAGSVEETKEKKAELRRRAPGLEESPSPTHTHA